VSSSITQGAASEAAKMYAGHWPAARTPVQEDELVQLAACDACLRDIHSQHALAAAGDAQRRRRDGQVVRRVHALQRPLIDDATACGQQARVPCCWLVHKLHEYERRTLHVMQPVSMPHEVSDTRTPS